MPKLNGELDKRFILAILVSFLLCNIVSWWLSDLLKRQNNRFKPTSASCDSPAVSKSDRQPSNFASYALNLSLIIALICCQLCALSCWLAVLVPINSQWFELLSGTFRSLISMLSYPSAPGPLSSLKTSLICAPFKFNVLWIFFMRFLHKPHMHYTKELFILVGPRMPFRFHQCQYRLLIVNSISLLIRSLNRKKISFKILKTKLSLVAPF